jgi:hypothetical protein
MIFYDSPGLVVSWDAAIKSAVLRFRGYTEGDDFRQAARSVLQVLEEKGANKLLTDARDMRAMTQEDQQWVDTEWHPRARAAGLTYNAVVQPRSATAKLSVVAVVRKFPAGSIELAYFTSLEEATKWLRAK